MAMPMAQPIYAYPGPIPMAPMGSGKWASGFCDCCGDPGNCCLCCKALWCPCIIYGEIAQRLTASETTCGGSGSNDACAVYCGADWGPPIIGCPGVGFLLHCQARQSVRRRYGIPEGDCCDCCVAYCCASCSFVQIHKELTVRNAPMVANGMGAPMQPMPGYAPGYAAFPATNPDQVIPAGNVPVAVARPINKMH